MIQSREYLVPGRFEDSLPKHLGFPREFLILKLGPGGKEALEL